MWRRASTKIRVPLPRMNPPSAWPSLPVAPASVPSPGLPRWHPRADGGGDHQTGVQFRLGRGGPIRVAPESDRYRIRVGSDSDGLGSDSDRDRVSHWLPSRIRLGSHVGRGAIVLSITVTCLRRWRAPRRRLALPAGEDSVSSCAPHPLPSSCQVPAPVRRRNSNRSALAFFRILVKLRFDAHSLRQTPDLRSIAGRGDGCGSTEQR